MNAGQVASGWRVVTVAELVEDITAGDWGQGGPGKDLTEVVVLRGTDFESAAQGSLAEAPVRFLTPQRVSTRKLVPGDLLVEMSGGSRDQATGRSVLITSDLIHSSSRPVCFSNFVKRVRFDSGLVDPGFAWLQWQLLYRQGRTRIHERRTTGIRNFKLDSFLSHEEFSLPLLGEQRAIAHVLHSVQRAKEATEQVLAAALEMKKSLMRHVFAHGPVSVTESEPADWPRMPLERLVQEDRLIRYGILKPGPEIDGGVPYVKVRDYPNGVVELGSLKHTSVEIAHQYKRASLQSGDILVSIRGTTGRVALVPSELEGGNITQDTARVSPGHSIDREYLVQYFRSEDAQAFIASWTKGAAVKGINLRELRQLPVPVPLIEVQRRIRDVLGAADAKVSAEEARRDALGTLFDSLLHDLMTARIPVGDLGVPA